MRTLSFTILMLLFSILIIAQDKPKEKSKDLVKVEEDHDRTNVTFPGGSVEVNHLGDTITKITIGRKRIEILDDESKGSTRIRMVHVPKDKFKGHWAGIDLGLNNYFSGPFESELPQQSRFMDLNSGKSISVGVNIIQSNIELQPNKNNIGLVTGIGLTFNNYRLDSPYILIRDAQGNTSYYQTERAIKKNKLTTTFLTVPVLIELQIPTSNDHKIFFSGGVYGGFKLGSHTKVVYSDNEGKEKEKSRSDLNVNSFKYGATVRCGYRFVKLYASYDLTRLFQAGMGPELYPWTVGITVVSF